MNEQSFSQEVLYEHQLWLKAMGDHGRFIHDALTPGEIERIEMSSQFIKVFDELLEQSKKQLHDEQIYELTKLAYAYTEEFNHFMQDVVREQLLKKTE